MPIFVTNTQRLIPISIHSFRVRAAAMVLAVHPGLDLRAWNVGIELCHNRRIASLNEEYRGKKGATDVLSFVYHGEDDRLPLKPEFSALPAPFSSSPSFAMTIAGDLDGELRRGEMKSALERGEGRHDIRPVAEASEETWSMTEGMNSLPPKLMGDIVISTEYVHEVLVAERRTQKGEETTLRRYRDDDETSLLGDARSSCPYELDDIRQHLGAGRRDGEDWWGNKGLLKPRDRDAGAMAGSRDGVGGGDPGRGIPTPPVVSRIDAERRLRRILAHGLCHLIGYTHNNERDQMEMQRVEDYMLGEADVVMRSLPQE